MCFLLSIGSIMAGSGIQSLFETIYGKSTVVHMLNGHAFRRAVIAHILTISALIHVIAHLHSNQMSYNP